MPLLGHCCCNLLKLLKLFAYAQPLNLPLYHGNSLETPLIITSPMEATHMRIRSLLCQSKRILAFHMCLTSRSLVSRLVPLGCLPWLTKLHFETGVFEHVWPPLLWGQIIDCELVAFAASHWNWYTITFRSARITLMWDHPQKVKVQAHFILYQLSQLVCVVLVSKTHTILSSLKISEG